MKIIDKEHQMELRENWLSERGLSTKDVLIDEDGDEYVMELAGEGEMEDGRMTQFGSDKRVYLPFKLTSEYIPLPDDEYNPD
jgi:hypothetical protein